MVDKYGKDGVNVKPQPKHKVHILRFHVNIGDNDRDRLLEKAKDFLSKKSQVKIQVQLRGREKSRPQVGLEFLVELLAKLDDFGTPVNEPRVDNLSVTMNPKKK